MENSEMPESLTVDGIHLRKKDIWYDAERQIVEK